MAVRFTGLSSEVYSSSASLPASNLFTITCWFNYPSLQANSTLWSLDGASTSAWLGTGSTSNTLRFDWSGTGQTHTIGGTFAAGNWTKVGVVVNGTAATMYHGNAAGLPFTYNEASNFDVYPGTLTTLRIGGSTVAGQYVNARIAAFKMWDAALSAAEVTQELVHYVPHRTADISRLHPFVDAGPTDFSGLARTLSGGTGVTNQDGPPIPWVGLRTLMIPWSPTTTVWYAHYDTTSGELLSLGTVYPDPFPGGTAVLELLGQPDQAVLEWSTTARTFVNREGTVLVDRVADLLADGTLTAAWADLSGGDSTAMQARIGQMLGPHRYRQSFQDPDLT